MEFLWQFHTEVPQHIGQLVEKGNIMYYNIDLKTFAISFFNEGSSVPFMFQPDYPNLDKFDSYEEAEIWANLQINSYEENEPYAPIGKNIPAQFKPTSEEIAINLQRLRDR